MAQIRPGQDLVTQNPANGEALAFFVGGNRGGCGPGRGSGLLRLPGLEKLFPSQEG
jgi:hypothetical protein